MFPQMQEESTPPRQKHCFRQKSMLKKLKQTNPYYFAQEKMFITQEPRFSKYHCGWQILFGKFFLSSGWNLRVSAFDHLNLLQR